MDPVLFLAGQHLRVENHIDERARQDAFYHQHGKTWPKLGGWFSIRWLRRLAPIVRRISRA